MLLLTSMNSVFYTSKKINFLFLFLKTLCLIVYKNYKNKNIINLKENKFFFVGIHNEPVHT